jgi:hypothetical protein
MTTQQLGIAFCLIMIALCVLVSWLDRPKRNRRTSLPRPFKDDRDSIQSFRRMYGK